MDNPTRAKRLGWTLVVVIGIGIAAYFGRIDLLAKAAIPAAVALIFGLARRFLPARALADKLGAYSGVTDHGVVHRLSH